MEKRPTSITVICVLLLLFTLLGAVGIAMAGSNATMAAEVSKMNISVPMYQAYGALGIIINRPTNATLRDLFPEDEPSKKVVDPLYLGGPEGYNRVFALVGKRDTAGKDALQMMPGVFLVSESKDIDRVIASDPEHARFFLGVVTWRPGQLDEELDRGYWYVDKADAKLVLEKKTDGLWEELVRRSEAKAHSI